MRTYTYNREKSPKYKNLQNNLISLKEAENLAGGEGFEPPSQAPEACALSWLGISRGRITPLYPPFSPAHLFSDTFFLILISIDMYSQIRVLSGR